eukprot:scaffold11511_cov100-Cylindrotheca_fusiformis.AAC.1
MLKSKELQELYQPPNEVAIKQRREELMGVARFGLLSEKEERSIIMRAVPGSYQRMLVDLQRNGSRKGRCLIRPKEMY